MRAACLVWFTSPRWKLCWSQTAAFSIFISHFKSSIRNKSWRYCELRFQLWNSVGSMREYLRRAMQCGIYAGHAEKCMLVIVQGSDPPYFGGFAYGRKRSQHSHFCHLKRYSALRLKVILFWLGLPPSDDLSSWLASADIVSPHETIEIL